MSITREIKKSFPDKTLLTIFGCGGDRDKLKRPLMAAAAETHSENIILTSDNPRFEDPLAIVNDAKTGFKKDFFVIILDRKKAITSAIEESSNDIILIAGKGNEDYLDIRGVKEPYSDLTTVLGAIDNA